MNGKKSKQLRRLAGAVREKVRSYEEVKGTARIRQHTGFTGVVEGRVRTCTLQLKKESESGARALYKTLKVGYKHGNMNPARW